MSWISIILLAAGAVAVYVPNTGSYDQFSKNGVQDPNEFGLLLGQQKYDQDQYQSGQYDQGRNQPGQYESGQYDENVSGQYGENQYKQRKYKPLGYSFDDSTQNYDQQSRKYGPKGYSSNQFVGSQQQNFEQFIRRYDQPGMGVYDSAAYLNHQKNVGVDDNNQNAAVAQRLVPDETREPPTDDDFGLDSIDADILDEMKLFDDPVFALFTKESGEPEKFKLRDAAKILKSPKFNKSKITMVYIHGFIEGLFSPSIKDVVRTYLGNGGYNVLIMDWHWYASPPYFLNAVPNVKKVGVKVARALLDMINSGLSTQHLHVVGHSLGGQMAGVIGRTVQRESGGATILQRISALDPAFPGFYGIPTMQPLNEYDAEYVDVLHTDVGVYGAPVSTGTVDFWPNGGLPPQPGCITNVCSHQRSWWYWGGSVLNNATNYFSAVKAKSWWSFRDGEVDEYDPKVFMGLTCPAGLSGNYYLQTNNKLPYARGDEGISFVTQLVTGALPPTPLLQPKEVIVPHASFF